MEASGGFITSLAGDESAALRPSFFELIAQDRLLPPLAPALKYVLSLLAQRDPRFVRWADRSEEIFTVAMAALEWSFLRRHDSSFEENFYGLCRARLPSSSALRRQAPRQERGSLGGQLEKAGRSTDGLRDRDRLLSLFFLVGMPYLRTKADEWFASQAGPVTPFGRLPAAPPEQSPPQRSEGTAWERGRRRLLEWAVKVYPYANAGVEASVFAYQALYLLGLTPHFTPWLRIQRLVIRRSTPRDAGGASGGAGAGAAGRGEEAGRAGRSLGDVVYRMLDGTRYALIAAVFLFKFLEWYYSVEPQGAGGLPAVPPPGPPRRALGGIPVPRDKRVCPLCRRPRTNAAVAPSGIAFCYPCLFAYVREHRRCPVTFLPASLDQLRRIYDNAPPS
eukprot:tig00001154_g7302.t1